MKLWKRSLPVLVLALVLVLPAVSSALELPKIVSTEWLEKNSGDPALRIVDIRKAEEYKAGHVPNAINQFYGAWAVTREKLMNQLPEEDELLALLEGTGIGKDTPVVVVGKVDTVADQVNQTRIAYTLRYAGVAQVGVLDGGFNKWVADKKAVSTEPGKTAAAQGKALFNKGILATKGDVLSKIGKATIVDTRTPDFFFGASKLPFVARAGHIPHAVSLPSAWIFTKEGAFRPKDELASMAEGVVGKDKAGEIILYCDTGRLASGWWFVLSEVFGYQNVRMYDGSSEEWAADANAPMVKHSWK
ncbi:MAG: sulfurtransferase [Deltaproteobacteria bacterium]|nr:sulfurtransferase [Deltaproteobacteria bacterium]